MRSSVIRHLATYLPPNELTNDDLAAKFDGWTAEKIEQKTGIRNRHCADESMCSSDLAFAAAERLLDGARVDRTSIDFLLFCTQSPDYFLPTTACLLQDRLKLPKHCGALDFNLGCSGYVAGLGLAKGLIASDQASNILLLTGETYTRMISPLDRSLRTIFGDAGSATLISGSTEPERGVITTVYGTDGGGADKLIYRPRAFREPQAVGWLEMSGRDVFAFTLEAVPELYRQLLGRAGLTSEDVDLVLLHQANEFMLNHLIAKLGLPREKCPILLENCGNTVSSTIPMLMESLQREGRLGEGQTLVLLGFGVGYSWAGAVVKT